MKYLLAILLLLNSSAVFSQIWRGAITDNESKQPLQAVTVTNTNKNIFVFTDAEGHFNIEANPGDKITFYCPGYKNETHIVLPGIDGIRLHFAMKLSSQELKEVIFKKSYATAYQNDSADRASTYSRALARQHSNIGSPVSLLADKLSRKSKNLYHFQKMYNKMEDEKYTDTKYTPELVKELTQLTGDTLAAFMNKFPIPYDYARSATDLELKMWIRYNYKQFLIQTDSLRKVELIKAEEIH